MFDQPLRPGTESLVTRPGLAGARHSVHYPKRPTTSWKTATILHRYAKGLGKYGERVGTRTLDLCRVMSSLFFASLSYLRVLCIAQKFEPDFSLALELGAGIGSMRPSVRSRRGWPRGRR